MAEPRSRREVTVSRLLTVSRLITIGRAVVMLLLCALPAHAQAVAQSGASVSGIVADDTGLGVVGARVTLSHDNRSPVLETLTQDDGAFVFASVPPGRFQLKVDAAGFAERSTSGVVVAGETLTLPPIHLTIAAGAETVTVAQTIVEVAQRQIEEQEQQRLFGVFPNFYVTYVPDAAPLNTRQKFELSWKSQLDPVQFGVVAATAGIQQARGDFPAFGDGWEGYAKRYAAAYATNATRSLVSLVVMPAIFRQDPRYFYKGTGSPASRTWYAITRSFVRKGDNGRSQPNYSGIFGGALSGAISNLYYPDEDRHGIRLMIENTAIGIASGAAGRLVQEFLFKKVTTRGSSN